MKKLLMFFVVFHIVVLAQEKKELTDNGIINVYFNKSVDASVAESVVANGDINFTQKLLNRIDSAKYSVDVCVYSFSGSPGTGDSIATALINAKNRGVKIRFIIEYDNSVKTATKALLDKLMAAGIPVLTDKCGSNDGSGLQHNKFFIFDNRDNSSLYDDWVITGSWNPTYYGTWEDLQNVLEIRDNSFASAYTTEFNEMWGSNGDNFDVTNARFGRNKTNNTQHIFTINGVHVEVYFSPSDRTLTKIVPRIEAARHSLNFSEMTFTNDSCANAIKKAYDNYKVNVRGIMDKDNINATGSKYLFFTSDPQWCRVMKSNYETGIYHHKYMIIDGERPSDENSWVLTGSYNITNSAEYYNNENLVFIRNGNIANQYMQEFIKRFKECGGVYTSVDDNPVLKPQSFQLLQNYPNPFNPETKISFSLSTNSKVKLGIYDCLGREIITLLDEIKPSGNYSVVWKPGNVSSGVYYYRLNTENFTEARKMVYVR